MGSAITDVVPAAFGVVLVNPLPLIAVIVMLFSPRAMTTAPMFVVGWAGGMIAAMGVLLFVASRDLSVGSASEPSPLASFTRLALGIVLFSLALRRWRGRPRSGPC